MVTQYPHTMTWTLEGPEATKDPVTGFPVPGANGQTVSAVCRYENFRGGNRTEYRNKKNETVEQRGTIFLKKGEPVPKKFETVVVTSPEYGEMFSGELLNVNPNQLNVTIAV